MVLRVEYLNEKYCVKNFIVAHQAIHPKKSTFLIRPLQVSELYFWNHHWMLTLFDLMVRDRADRSGCSNHQFYQNDSIKKNTLALFGTFRAPWGKFFWTVRKTVNHWWFLYISILLLWALLHTENGLWFGDWLITDEKDEKKTKKTQKNMKECFFGKTSAEKNSCLSKWFMHAKN